MKMGLIASSLRRRTFLFFMFVLVPCTVLFLLIGTDFTAEQTMSQRVAEFQMRMQYLESMYRAKQEDVAILSQYLGFATQNGDSLNVSMNLNLLDGLSADSRSMIRNVSASTKLPASLKLPTAFHFLPHLLDDSASLKPAFHQTKNRQGVSVVLGIPTVKRDKQSYLVETVDNLIANMDDDEQNETMIVIFIGESDLDYVTQVANSINLRFPTFIESGFIEIISPAASYYPDMSKLRQTLNDSLERVKWRSKQNLDFAYLMAYTQPKGAFYVQLEDDILTKKGFISIMKNFALKKTAKKEQSQWFVLDFCQLGFIGKMFKSADLPWLITFFQMFFNDKPVDWLLYHLIYTKICSVEKDAKTCKQEMSKLWIHYKPSLFQHIGTTSSLKGKVQKLKDKQFGKIPTFYPHNNPPALVKTGIQHYRTYTIQKAYTGESFFWGLMPQPGDLIEFKFKQPVTLKRYLFRSGNFEQPSDRFYNTTIEVLPFNLPEDSPLWSSYNTTSDGFLVLGTFNDFGIADGVVDAKIGDLKELRLHVYSDSQNWVILREILLQDNTVR
ncbi:alpha-1,3-mannosyl-glycoprotein 4-beta-N-acetylglucosaminyltransferase B [Toxorhynchites rutilus septentrionalis]|uniref:alpha-1,3-mannosyl-glycoprotein 4-beta-N-acetylglucosaminyltransferase B n=1 Tax=Toxorhynchites rutilus septentrionalis TaxID=329112 RepID=UPI002478703E|nr:alpha-1,3-mannosyl-glycoprotein 4-beta-N-acetylglucosaminyltransferase B [Toxorhynchites rutilus septentrionalis]XP_055637988.1 alpha-1,3-mannosyl-glycoprotein 4-beta-N-acetylglucosaminyltransferase B [Toxorhynchites rutilus septentrionalis]XP_055637989.1 alpha-1,3-mannosyl-glycoprotein 4-beta-N-acetylglucosaminyltransferase B [Toxorhynchites rutilus septentrionalis]